MIYVKSLKLFLSAFMLLSLSVQPVFAEDHGAKKEESKEGEAPVTPEGPAYINVNPMILPVIGNNGPEQLVTVIVTLELENAEKSDEVKNKLPRLNDAYLQTLYGALDTRSINRGSLIDVTRVKKRLQAPTERILGKGIVKEILVQAVAQRRL